MLPLLQLNHEMLQTCGIGSLNLTNGLSQCNIFDYMSSQWVSRAGLDMPNVPEHLILRYARLFPLFCPCLILLKDHELYNPCVIRSK